MKIYNRQAGFTLIEVLVAMGVVAFGLLAVVAMHGKSMFYTVDSVQQWEANQAVFRIFNSMRARLHNSIIGSDNRVNAGFDVLNRYSYTHSGTLTTVCPGIVVSEIDELRCLQKELQKSLPDGRIDSIVVPPAINEGVTVTISWVLNVASGTEEEEKAQCEALKQVDLNADASIKSTVSSASGSDCLSIDNENSARRVAQWVLVP